MELSTIIPHIEALIFAHDKPLTVIDITLIINQAFELAEEEKITTEQVISCIEGVQEKYSSDFYAFEVREVGGGFQFLTKPIYHKTILELQGNKHLKKLSTAAMETLAIIAYKQPISKGEIETIRGVNCDYSIQKLLEKELIIISGRHENLPGQPLHYSISTSFMNYFGINSIDELPKLSDIQPIDLELSKYTPVSTPANNTNSEITTE